MIGRAQRNHAVDIHAAVILSNHYHLLISVQTALQLASFMREVNSNLAKEAGRLYGWRDRFWGRRYRATLVSEETEAQVDRMRYVLAQGCKENLVESPLDWPGVSCVRALLEGRNLKGIWVDRTRRYRAQRQGISASSNETEQAEEVVFSPLPCWSSLSPEVYCDRIRNLVEGVEDAAAKARKNSGMQKALGARRICRRHPHHRPVESAKSPAPMFHCATKEVRIHWLAIYREFLGAYREAVSLLRQGVDRVEFPAGCFPPALLRPG
ncbi:MAG: transposase [Acidobacteriota bacterium]